MDVLDLNKTAIQWETFIQVAIVVYVYKTHTVPTYINWNVFAGS